MDTAPDAKGLEKVDDGAPPDLANGFGVGVDEEDGLENGLEVGEEFLKRFDVDELGCLLIR